MCKAKLLLSLSIAWVFTLALLSSLPAMAQSNTSEKPNVIIILADDLGYGDVSSNNRLARTRTPNIDDMGKTGIRFTDAHSGGAVCTPSRYGLLTGRYFFRVPSQKATWGYLAPIIELGRETIGSLMQKAGYTTACIGKWHLGLDWSLKDPSKPHIPDVEDLTYTNTDFRGDIRGGPNSLGFDYSFILPASLDMPPYVFVKNGKVIDPDVMLTADAYQRSRDETSYVWDKKHTVEGDIYWGRGVWWRNGEMSRSFKIETCFDEIVSEGISFIREQTLKNPRKPFMLYLPLTGPHTPWVPNENFQGKSALGTYGDFVSQVDNVVYEITETLKSLNIADNTLLIFSSDNGAHWAEDDVQTYAHQANWSRRGQKGDIWDGGHHIPLFVKWPSRIKNAGVYNQTVSLNDIIATLSEMTGQPIAHNYAEDSFSFFKVLAGRFHEAVRDHIIYISSAGELALKKDEWKFIDCLGSGGFTTPTLLPYVAGGPQGQLYNLDEDPLESTNLYLRETSKVKELSGLLERLETQGFSR